MTIALLVLVLVMQAGLYLIAAFSKRNGENAAKMIWVFRENLIIDPYILVGGLLFEEERMSAQMVSIQL